MFAVVVVCSGVAMMHFFTFPVYAYKCNYSCFAEVINGYLVHLYKVNEVGSDFADFVLLNLN